MSEVFVTLFHEFTKNVYLIGCYEKVILWICETMSWRIRFYYEVIDQADVYYTFTDALTAKSTYCKDFGLIQFALPKRAFGSSVSMVYQEKPDCKYFIQLRKYVL